MLKRFCTWRSVLGAGPGCFSRSADPGHSFSSFFLHPCLWPTASSSKAAGQDLNAVQTFKVLFDKVMVSKLSPHCHFLSALIRKDAQNVLPPPFYQELIEDKKTEFILFIILFLKTRCAK